VRLSNFFKHDPFQRFRVPFTLRDGAKDQLRTTHIDSIKRDSIQILAANYRGHAVVQHTGHQRDVFRWIMTKRHRPLVGPQAWADYPAE
jgi:hypothetical protein